MPCLYPCPKAELTSVTTPPHPTPPPSPAAGPDAAAAAGPAAAAAAPLPLLDGPGRYELLGIVSHIGANTGCGHYVAHVKKEGRWAIFDDEKVAASEAPPFDRGYLYLYRRCE